MIGQEGQRSIRVFWPIVGRVVIALVTMFVTFSVAFLLTRWGMRRVGLHRTDYAAVMITVGVAFCLIAVVGASLSPLGLWRQRQVWQSLLDFIRQMARGNFEVRIDAGSVGRHQSPDHPFQQLIESLNTMAADLGAMEAMRQEFIGNVSHDIQSPLAAIAGFARLLKTETLTAEQQSQYLDIIHDESQRLSRLTENLLQLTSLESGHHPVHLEPLVLDHQIRTAVVALEPLWSARKLVVEVSLSPLTVTADADLLNQVWVNLLSNAIKFTPEGGTIEIVGERVGDFAVILVTDSGIGVSPADQVRIFERFYKSDRARTRTTSGSGLGLAIAKTIVEMHRGTISVESEPNRGTTVSVRLPA